MKNHKQILSTAILAAVLSLGSLGVTSCATPSQSATTSTPPLPPLRQRVDATARVLQGAVDKNIAAGFAVALTDSTGRTEKAFVGLAERETNKAIDNETVYRLYSMTKPVTAVAIMMLVEDGKIDLDVPLSTYIPSFASSKVYRICL